MKSETQKYLLSIYDGVLAEEDGLGVRLANGEVRGDEFRTLFTVYDKRDRSLPSLGMFISLQTTYLLLTDGLAEWTRQIADNVSANRQVRDWLQTALHPRKHHTHESAMDTMRGAPQVRRVLIAGTLMEFGFAAARGWVSQAGFLIQDGKNVVEEIILQHLQEAPIREIRAFMGANTAYDNTELLNALGDRRVACADVASRRAPELFFYHGHKLGLDEDVLTRTYQWLIFGNGYHFTLQQKHELVTADWLSTGVQEFLREHWGIPE